MFPILQEVVTAVSQTGLLPKALVCDQGSTFQSCMNSMRADTRRCQLLRNDPPSKYLEFLTVQNMTIHRCLTASMPHEGCTISSKNIDVGY